MSLPEGGDALLRLLAGNGNHAEPGVGPVAQVVVIEFRQLPLTVGTPGVEEDNHRGTSETDGRELPALQAVGHLDGEARQLVPHPDDRPLVGAGVPFARLVDDASAEQADDRKYVK